MQSAARSKTFALRSAASRRFPFVLTKVERIVKGKSVEPELVQLARKAVAAAIQPIDDIRSTARYRAAVAANLVAEFLQQLGAIRRGDSTHE